MAKEMRICIKEFLQHVETLEGEADPDGCGFNREYRLIHELQIKNRRENVFKSDAGKEEQNLKKNRYKDILPYDDHRVMLSVVENDENGSDYINASLLKGVKGSGGYIATQGPLAATVNDFWQLIWEKEIEIVFMACRIVELGKIKCKQYWNDIGQSDEFGDITVFTETEEHMSSDFIHRTFRVTSGEKERMVTQYHYSGWPDHGIPDDPAHIRDLIAMMRLARQKPDVPLVVHCSAGCGRTGAIIAIDYVWTLLEEGKLDENFSLYKLICNFREQRMSIVQTPDQYALVYRVLKSLCEDWLTKMASHTYENVEIDDQYVNVGDVTTNQEEHVYEDTKSLVQSVNNLKSDKNSIPSDLNRKISTSENQTPKVSEPKTLPQSPKSKVSPDAGNYVNVALPPNNSPRRTSSSSNDPSDEKVLHKTVIQIGAASKPVSSTSAGGDRRNSQQREVVNMVHHGKAPLTKSLSEPNPNRSRPGSTTSQNSATSQKSKSFKGGKLVEVPDQPPGFNERMPRVRGPTAPPAHWNKT